MVKMRQQECQAKDYKGWESGTVMKDTEVRLLGRPGAEGGAARKPSLLYQEQGSAPSEDPSNFPPTSP